MTIVISQEEIDSLINGFPETIKYDRRGDSRGMNGGNGEMNGERSISVYRRGNEEKERSYGCWSPESLRRIRNKPVFISIELYKPIYDYEG